MITLESIPLNVDRIPKELQQRNQWVNWRYEEREGKRTKVPVTPSGKHASSTDSSTWSSFDAVVRASVKFDGIGFVFNDDFIGVDLDHAYDEEGLLKPWAYEILSNCSTYAEKSPSSTGVHAILRGALPKDWTGRKRTYHDGAVEIYSRARFFTVTGNHLESTPETTGDQTAYILELYEKLSGTNGGGNASSTRNGHRRAQHTLSVSHGDRLELALRDPVFSRLWYGDTSRNNNDDSASDLALCNKIVFYYGPDPEVVDRVFRQSKLYRPKWERADYRQWTISKAIEGTTETYRPSAKRRSLVDPISDQRGEISGREPRAEQNSDDDSPKPAATLKNAVRTIIENHLADIRYDEFLCRPMTSNPAREWTDADDRELCVRLQTERGFGRIGLETVRNAALVIAFRARTNCVKDWLESLTWDRESRIDRFFDDHFGAAGTAYIRAASRNFWLSMVARVYQPGCQVDNVIVLEGPQGIRKSSALREIGGEWFTEQHESATGKAFFEVLQGKLLVEISEMDSFSKVEVTKVKQVVTCRNDRFRESYGRHAKDHPRQCIFVGTTNRDDWNRDETGARRFWPIACKEIDLEAIRLNREQCFAEAVHRFKGGESWWEMPAEETRTQQSNRYIAPAWAEAIERYVQQERVDDDDGFRWIQRPEPLKDTSMAEILQFALDIPKSQWTKANEMRVGESLRYLGWIKKDVRRDGKIVKRWLLLPEGGNAAEGGNS